MSNKLVYPPRFIAFDANDAWQKPDVPSLDTRLALAKDKMSSSSQSKNSAIHSTFPSSNSKRMLVPSPFKKSPTNRDFIAQTRGHNRDLVSCRLPQDIYAKIFAECVQLPLEDLADWSWMNVSYVCRSWRNGALNTKKLWAFIDFSNPARTAISLHRAKGEPLSIRAVVGQHNLGSLKSVLNNAHRINSIRLQSTAHNILPLLETLAYPHPTLTTLALNVISHESHYPQPDFPLIGQESMLRTVELNASPLFLISYRCPALTHLTLRNLPLSERRSDIHKFFSNLPQLQLLVVSCCTLQGEAPSYPIHLSALRCLRIEGSLLQVADFLALVYLPASCQLFCSLNELDDLSDNLWRLCQAIGMHSYASSRDTPIETLALTCTEVSSRFTTTFEPNLDFRQSIRIRAFGPRLEPDCAILSITIGPGNQAITDDTMITTLTGIWRALFLTGVRTLSIQNVDILTQKTWSQFLRTLPQLRVLDIRGHAPSGLVWALLLDAMSSEASAPRFLVPRLDDVYLYRVDCSSGGFMLSPKGQTNSHVDVDDSSFLDVFVVALTHRRWHKMGLRSLTVARCENVVEERLTELKSTASHFVWDIRGREKEVSVGYRNTHLNEPCNGLRHYNRLEALFS